MIMIAIYVLPQAQADKENPIIGPDGRHDRRDASFVGLCVPDKFRASVLTPNPSSKWPALHRQPIAVLECDDDPNGLGRWIIDEVSANASEIRNYNCQAKDSVEWVETHQGLAPNPDREKSTNRALGK